jgi:2-dehydro-3-deoxyphosphooctonate aldolase (KDO 8-P synthase)
MKMKEFIIIAGPCLAESKEQMFEVAKQMSKICSDRNIKYYFKASFKKANRTSADSFTGIGDEKALKIMSDLRQEFGVDLLTDVHSKGDVELAAKYVQALQIPAFLARQTDLLIAAGNTGLAVNIKKAQFMSPHDMVHACGKVASTGNKNIWQTERGTTFGYNNLVVDFRSLEIMKKNGFPVIFDATHSVQLPSLGAESGGLREFIPTLTRAALAVGVDGIFFETHPNPGNAKSDKATQLPLDKAEKFVDMILETNEMSVKMNEKYNLKI